MPPALDNVFFSRRILQGRPLQVVGFGLNAVDWICRIPHFPHHNTKVKMDSMQQLGGGQVATAMALCGRYGMRASYIGRTGDDEEGNFSRASLESEPIQLQLEQIPGAGSLLSIILVDRPTGNRTIVWKRDSVLAYTPETIDRDSIVQGEVLHLDGHDQEASIAAARRARSSGMTVSLDIDKVQPGVEELLSLTDYTIPSESFILNLTGLSDWRQALMQVNNQFPGVMAMTRGEHGCAAIWEGQIWTFPGYSVKPIDATGAGDVFHGAFLYALLKGWSVGRCLDFATVAGALATTRVGARAGIPDRAEVLRICRSRWDSGEP